MSNRDENYHPFAPVRKELGIEKEDLQNDKEKVEKRTIVAHSHSHPAAYDCGLYLQNRIVKLKDRKFTVEEDRVPGMWKLIFYGDLDTLDGKVDLEFTHSVVDQARAFITGRGGLSMPIDGR
jgi:hypothetical protein